MQLTSLVDQAAKSSWNMRLMFSLIAKRETCSFRDKHFNCKMNSVFKLLCNQPVHLYLKRNIHTCGSRQRIRKGGTKALRCNQTEIACLLKQNRLLQSLPCLQFVNKNVGKSSKYVTVHRSRAGDRFSLFV